MRCRSCLPLLLLLSLLVLRPAALAAQIVQYDMQVFAPGVSTTTGTPQWTNTYQVTTLICNQVAPAVPPTVTNPTRFFLDDPLNAGKVCLAALAVVLLPGLPNGVGYVATLTATDNVGQVSPRSTPSNSFTRQGPPVAPTGFKVTP